ncbi:hypothetical protein [Paenibacillus sp. NPDC058071]|uniref:hypothetical protein n=1 Tax=Paenibacillus sp. NPDC058071 TaxID=3346326 RepID=UPI0036DDA54C
MVGSDEDIEVMKAGAPVTLTVNQILEEMKETGVSMLSLDLEEEANHGLLFSLQNRQAELRELIRHRVELESHVYNDLERQLLMDCLTVERELMKKMLLLKEEAGKQLKQISEGKRSRNAYQQDMIQHIGYFIDNHK